MTLLNALLGINWLEQKHQGRLTREVLAPKPWISPALSAEIDTQRKKEEADPNGFSAWSRRQGGLKLLRITFFGMTKTEETEALKAYQHSIGYAPKYP